MLNKGFANILRVTWQQSVCWELIEGCPSIVHSLYKEGRDNPRIEWRSQYMANRFCDIHTYTHSYTDRPIE